MGSAEAPAIWQHSVSQVQRTGLRVARDNPQGTPGTGRLLYTWNDGRGRWNTIPVGSDATARLAARVYDLVPEGGTAIGLPDLIREAGAAGIETEQALRVLWVLRRFDILRTPRDNEK